MNPNPLVEVPKNLFRLFSKLWKIVETISELGQNLMEFISVLLEGR